MSEPALNSAGPVVHWEADACAVVARHAMGVTRIEAVSEDILRVRFAPGAFLARREWAVTESLDAPPLRCTAQDGRLRVRVGVLSARLDLHSGRLGFSGEAAAGFAEDLEAPAWRDMSLAEIALEHLPEPELPPGPARTGVFLHKGLRQDERCFGFGQRTGLLDRRHRRLTNWTVDRSSPGHSWGNDNMYQAHPVALVARPGFCWGLFMHSTWYSGFDAGYGRDDTLTLFTLGGELDYYLLAGPTPAAVVEQLTRLTGRPALPPLWALGYHQSRWSYGSAAEVERIAAEFRRRAIPLDCIHLDIDYMDGFRVFTWDETRFPDPRRTVDGLHARGIRAVAIVDPGVKAEFDAGYAVADTGAAGDHFVKRPDGRLFTGHVWPGESLFPDFCRTATRRWWGDWHAGLVAAGVDGIWCDMNEPSIADRPFRTPGVHDQPIPLSARQGDAGEATHAETHNLYGMLMVQATAEGLERLRPGRRPWVLTRSGYQGVQRWAASWMGDNSAWWEHLEMSLPQLANMGLCGSAHVGVDIGGFYHDCPPELFARWMELGAFYPFMRGHSHHRTRPHEPWAFGPEIETLVRRAIETRYRLLPYLYTLAHRAYRTGEPLLRPMFYDFADDARFLAIGDQVMIGPLLLVAPVCRPGVTRRLVELPPGDWYDLHDGTRHTGGPMVAEAPLGRMPAFVRGGSVLTLGNLRQSTAEPVTELTLRVYPGSDRLQPWILIEDDGESLAYRRGVLAETRFDLVNDTRGSRLTIAPRRGPYRPPVRRITVEWRLGTPPDEVRLDGARVRQWQWDPAARVLRLDWADDGAGRVVEVGPTE